jgi:hypothetical protein
VLVAAVKELNAKTDENAELKAQLANTNATVAAMQKQIDDMCANGCYALKGVGATGADQSPNMLMQNSPNPFSGQTSIGYVINTGSSAMISINSLDGKVVQQIPITTKGAGQIAVSSASINAGTYTYSLTIDNAIIDTKIMVITASK